MYISPSSSHWKQGQQLSKQVAQELIAAAHRQFNTRSASQNVQVLPFGTSIEPSHGPEFGHGIEMFAQSFLARIILPPPEGFFDPEFVGPPGSSPADFADERYWVREVYIADPTEPKTFEMPGFKTVSYEVAKHEDGDKLNFEMLPDPPHVSPTVPQRVLVATNIAELAMQTHGLGVPTSSTDGKGQYVLCHTISGWNRSQFTIFDTAVAAAAEFVVVQGIILEPVFALRVRPVAVNVSTNRVEWSGESVNVWPWPNTPVSYYKRYQLDGDSEPDNTTPILRAQQIGGQWHVEQNLRHRLPVYPTNQRFTDCAPPSFEVPSNAVGACCQALGACGVLSQPQCEEAGGTYMGDGTTCNVIDCCTVDGIDCEEVGPQP